MSKQTDEISFDLTDYMPLQPKCSKRAMKTICIMQNSEIRLNGNLMKAIDFRIPHYAAIFLHKSQNSLVVVVSDSPSDKAAWIKKNGRFAMEDAAAQLKKRGIKTPACFEVTKEQDNGVWLAVYREDYRFPEAKPSKKKLDRPRKVFPAEVFA